MTRWVCALIAAAGLGAGLGATLVAQSGSPAPAGFSIDFIDRTANACTDFYQFACGNWMKQHPLPADRSRYGRMQQLADRNDEIVRTILERAARPNARTPDEQRLGDYYASCMDERTIDARGTAPLLPLLQDISRLASRTDLVRMAGRLTRMGLPGLLNLGSAPDARDASTLIATLGQPTLGLPDRDLYLRDDARSSGLRTEYVTHVQRIFELLGEPAPQAAQAARAVMDVETLVAGANYDRVTLRDPRRRDNPTTVAELGATIPTIDIAEYVRLTGAPAFTRLNVINPQGLQKVAGALETLPLDSWKRYFAWRVVSSLADDLSTPFQRERFRFVGGVLSGQKEMLPRWKRCSAAVAGTFGDDQLGEIVGQIFVREHFGSGARARMTELIAALEGSLRSNIEGLEWMDSDTRGRALEKLKAIEHKIGSTDRWRNFSRVTTTRGDYLGNVLNVAEDEARRQLGRIGTRIDPSLWLMTPQTVNAYYSPSQNEIVFPAGILQPPYFEAARDDAVNFGGIGAVIGHELSHGFDDQGRKFDAKGNLTDWWTGGSDAAFKERAACMATQYGAYPTADTTLNGTLTLGENVADNAGVRIAYYALMEVLAKKPPQAPLDGFTQEQRFFLSWAQIWCENATDQDFRRRAQEDTHASGRWRANGVLMNSPEFRKAFGCQAGTPMAPPNACRVW